MAGVELARVAEVITEASGERRRGSGYEVVTGSVLTAAHVVANASEVMVRFNADQPDEHIAGAQVSMADQDCDVAVLSFPHHRPAQGLVPASFGLIGTRPAVVDCVSVGFPRFKLREDTSPRCGVPPRRYRDSHQANGTVSSLSSAREGTLEFLVAPPEADPDADHSPWEGMSGAPLWCGSRIVGLISEHHRREGLNRLVATRVSRWYEVLSAEQLGRLCALTGLPGRASQLPDVSVASPPGSRSHPHMVVSGEGNVVYANTTIVTENFTGRDSVDRRDRPAGSQR
jgi:trypsin-like peptidase